MLSNKTFIIAAAAAALTTTPALADPKSPIASQAKTEQSAPVAQATTAARPASGDVIDVVKGDAQFSTFARAVEAAGLTSTLEDATAKTVFAPTNEAFAALPAGTLDTLLKPENRQQLVTLLNNHVVPATATSQQLAGRNVRATAVGGQQLTIDARDGVKVNDARVIRADLRASNGVVHGIDKVLMPPT